MAEGSKAVGAGAVMLSSALFGVSGVVAKMMFSSNLSAVQVSALRTLIAAGLLVLMMLVLDSRSLQLRSRHLVFHLQMGVLWLLVSLTFYLAVVDLNVAVALTIQFTAPVIIIIGGLLRGRRVFDAVTAAVIVMSVVGCFLVTGAYHSNPAPHLVRGLIWGFISAGVLAAYSLWGNRGAALGVTPRNLTVYALVFGGALWLLASPWLDLGAAFHTGHPVETAEFLGFLALGATIVPVWLSMEALKRLDAFQATIIGLMEPVVAALAGSWLMGETLDGPQIVGIGLISAAILGSQRVKTVAITPVTPV